MTLGIDRRKGEPPLEECRVGFDAAAWAVCLEACLVAGECLDESELGLSVSHYVGVTALQ